MQMIAKTPDYTVLPLRRITGTMLLYYINLLARGAKIFQKLIKLARIFHVTATTINNISRYGKFVRKPRDFQRHRLM